MSKAQQQSDPEIESESSWSAVAYANYLQQDYSSFNISNFLSA